MVNFYPNFVKCNDNATLADVAGEFFIRIKLHTENRLTSNPNKSSRGDKTQKRPYLNKKTRIEIDLSSIILVSGNFTRAPFKRSAGWPVSNPTDLYDDFNRFPYPGKVSQPPLGPEETEVFISYRFIFISFIFPGFFRPLVSLRAFARPRSEALLRSLCFFLHRIIRDLYFFFFHNVFICMFHLFCCKIRIAII